MRKFNIEITQLEAQFIYAALKLSAIQLSAPEAELCELTAQRIIMECKQQKEQSNDSAH